MFQDVLTRLLSAGNLWNNQWENYTFRTDQRLPDSQRCSSREDEVSRRLNGRGEQWKKGVVISWTRTLEKWIILQKCSEKPLWLFWIKLGHSCKSEQTSAAGFCGEQNVNSQSRPSFTLTSGSALLQALWTFTASVGLFAAVRAVRASSEQQHPFNLPLCLIEFNIVWVCSYVCVSSSGGHFHTSEDICIKSKLV